jgi:hypothetical protein
VGQVGEQLEGSVRSVLLSQWAAMSLYWRLVPGSLAFAPRGQELGFFGFCTQLDKTAHDFGEGQVEPFSFSCRSPLWTSRPRAVSLANGGPAFAAADYQRKFRL